MKPSNLAPPGKLHPLELPDIPWMEVTADFFHRLITIKRI